MKGSAGNLRCAESLNQHDALEIYVVWCGIN